MNRDISFANVADYNNTERIIPVTLKQILKERESYLTKGTSEATLISCS